MNKKKMIVCAVGLKASVAEWTELAVVGKWKGHVAGEFELSVEDLKQIAVNFSNAKAKDVVVDFEHQSMENIKAEATGWAVDLKVSGTTLFVKIEWLEETKKLIKSKKYKYLSPVLVMNTLDPVSGENIGWTLHSIALTNTPFFQELDEVILNKQSNGDPIPKKEEILDKEQLAELEALKKEKKSWLDENQKLKDEITKLKKVTAEAKVDEAVAAKKIHPQQRDSMLAFSANDPEGFAEFLKNAKVTTAAPGSNDMFAGSQGQGDSQELKYDVLKLGGVE